MDSGGSRVRERWPGQGQCGNVDSKSPVLVAGGSPGWVAPNYWWSYRDVSHCHGSLEDIGSAKHCLDVGALPGNEGRSWELGATALAGGGVVIIGGGRLVVLAQLFRQLVQALRADLGALPALRPTQPSARRSRPVCLGPLRAATKDGVS